ncbi:type II toxin-antitoxin system RelE family toxin [Desulfolutivibrio sulfodismutans]|nr:type II toxin-antitoxin system RelE/ParE family toxin [Desulfolutivibrio sulfodismutans]
MACKLDMGREAAKFLETLPPKQFRQVVLRMFELLREPLGPDTLALRGHADFRRADIGEYRIIYRQEAEVVRVALIGKRNDDEVYRRFKRL